MVKVCNDKYTTLFLAPDVGWIVQQELLCQKEGEGWFKAGVMINKVEPVVWFSAENRLKKGTQTNRISSIPNTEAGNAKIWKPEQM